MTPTLLDMARKAGFTVCREESTLGEMLESFAKLIIEHEAAKWYPYGSIDDVTRDLKAEVEASNKMHAELLGLKVAAQQALEVLDWLLKEDPWAKPDVIGVRNALRRGLEQPTDLPPDFINALKFDVAMRDTANEPVAWATAVGSNAHISWGKDRPDYPIRYEVPLYTTPPAAPVQEPDLTEIPMIMTCTKCGAFGEAMLTLETQPAQKPVNVTSKMVQAFLYAAGRHFPWGGSDPAIEDGIKAALEAMPTPPAAQREWVGLTDEQLQEIEAATWGAAFLRPQSARDYYRAIEARLREKNSA